MRKRWDALDLAEGVERGVSARCYILAMRLCAYRPRSVFWMMSLVSSLAYGQAGRLEEHLVKPLEDPLEKGPPKSRGADGGPTPRTQIVPRMVRTQEGLERARAEREARARADKNRSPMDPALVGEWEIRVPTGVSYKTDGVSTIREIQPGAKLGRLELRRNGSFRFGPKAGRAAEVWPSFGKDGERYFAVADEIGNYLVTRDGKGAVSLLFTTGGYCAAGRAIVGKR